MDVSGSVCCIMTPAEGPVDEFDLQVEGFARAFENAALVSTGRASQRARLRRSPAWLLLIGA